MKTIWIIGVGKFGRRAYQTLAQEANHLNFVLVDPDNKNLEQHQGTNCEIACMDGVAFLRRNLKASHAPDWIIPALPVHLAAEWCLATVKAPRFRRCKIPSTLDRQVPNPMRVLDGNLYASHAHFKCPDDCDEPDDICTITRQPRKEDMFTLLKRLDAKPFRSTVIRSHQLGPGIGGYRPEQLFRLLDEVERSQTPLLICTACRCHGVITGLKPIESKMNMRPIPSG